MKSKKYNRYKRIKESFIVGASGGLVAGMIFMGSANTALAEGAETRTSYYQSLGANSTGMHLMRKWNSRTKIEALASNLGLDQRLVSQELKSGKNLKQILLESGLDTTELDKAFNGKSRHKSWKKHTIKN